MATADGSSLPTSSIAQSLPPYIIYEILRHFSAPLVLYRFDISYPWYLAHICSSWRTEFLTMRVNFWDEIKIRIRNHHSGLEKRLHRIADALTMFLERNRGYPFSFELDVQSGPGAARGCPHFFAIFNLFRSESPRWRRATLIMGADDITGFYHVKGQLEHLESLHLSCTDTNPTVPEMFTDLFMTAPSLTRLSLDGFLTWNFNWSIMTFLYFRWIQEKEVALFPSILSQAVRLQTLIIFLDGEILPSITSIVFPSLLSLATDAISLIQAVTTPSLEELYVSSERLLNRGPALLSALKSLFDRSRCHLQALKLESIYAASVIEILSHTPDIRTLYLASIHDSVVDVFGWLIGMDRVGAPELTSLQSLAVYGCHPPAQERMYKIFDFVAQRKMQADSVEKLQKLDIKWCCHPDTSNALEKQLVKMCKLYDIQYQCTNWNMAVTWEPEDVHNRS